MKQVITALAVLAALCLMLASGSMNFLFWLTQGHTERESNILGSVSVAFDVFKSVLPIMIAWAWTHRKPTYVAVGSVLFLLFFSFGFFSALGFAAGNRGMVSGGRESLGLGLETASTELETSKARLKELGKTRSKGVIEAEITGLKQEKFWQVSTLCTAPSGYLAQTFCKNLSAKQTELAAAAEADRLMKVIGELTAKIQGLKSQGAGGDKDPQAGMLADLLGVELSMAQKVLIVAFAFLVELGAAFGLFLATGHSFDDFGPPDSGSKPEKAAPLSEKPAAVHIEARSDIVPPSRRIALAPLRLKQLENGALVVEQEEGETMKRISPKAAPERQKAQ